MPDTVRHIYLSVKGMLPARGRMLLFTSVGERSVAARDRDAGGANTRRCAAMGWVGGVYPSAHITARTAAFDGQRTSTRAARSAGLRFAVILLSKTMDVGRDHLIHREAVPLPLRGEGLNAAESG